MKNRDHHGGTRQTDPDYSPFRYPALKKLPLVQRITLRSGLVHNHPSGDPTPSKADIAVTQEIKKAAALLGLTLHDHVIIGRNRHASLRELGLI